MWRVLVGLALVLSACTPTISTVGGYTPEELVRVAAAARAECELRRGPAGVPPNPFTTDGCSFWPDCTWRPCCVDHDKWYWCGGSEEDRRKADALLRECVARHSATAADMTWAGVRAMGAPWLPFWWRWGYGWPWPHGYTAPE